MGEKIIIKISPSGEILIEEKGSRAMPVMPPWIPMFGS